MVTKEKIFGHLSHAYIWNLLYYIIKTIKKVSSANMLQMFTEYPFLGLPSLIFSFIGLYTNIHTFYF